MDPLFAPLPENLSDLSQDDLQAYLDTALATVDAITAGDADVVGDRSATDLVSEMEAGVQAIETVKAEIGARDVAAQEAADQIAALADRAHGPQAAADGDGETPPADQPADGEGDGEGADAPAPADGDGGDTPPPADGDTPPADGEGDDEGDGDTPDPQADADKADEPAALPIAAGAGKRTPASAAVGGGRVPARHRPRKSSRPSAIIASADVPGVSAGGRIDGIGQLSEVMVKKHDAIKRAALDGSRVSIATIDAQYPEDRLLVPGEDAANAERIDAVTSPAAIVASGGVCAPVSVYYDLLDLTTTDRPVRDNLPSFNAVRGGIRFSAPPVLADITTAVGVITEAEDTAGGSSGTKTCQVMDCDTFSEVDVDAIYHCLTFGNLPARTWPERVAHFISLAAAAHARIAETNLLDGIAAHSTAVTDAQVVANASMVADFFPAVIKAAAGYRSRHRMDPNTTMRAFIPAWVRDMAVADLMRSQFYMESAARNFLDDKLALAGVRATYYLDTPTGGGQVMPAQASGALNDWPTTAIWYLFSEGSFLHLDGGTLELGLVRDSTLNSTNDYQIFGETWEQIAFVGVESLQVTSTMHDTGAFAAPVVIPNAG